VRAGTWNDPTLMVTPELALMGYLPRDLLMNRGFIRRGCEMVIHAGEPAEILDTLGEIARQDGDARRRHLDRPPAVHARACVRVAGVHQDGAGAAARDAVPRDADGRRAGAVRREDAGGDHRPVGDDERDVGAPRLQAGADPCEAEARHLHPVRAAGEP
jgi:hypothetical protein